MEHESSRRLGRRVAGALVPFVVFQVGFWLYWWLVPREDFSLLVVLLIALATVGVDSLYDRWARRRVAPVPGVTPGRSAGTARWRR